MVICVAIAIVMASAASLMAAEPGEDEATVDLGIGTVSTVEELASVTRGEAVMLSRGSFDVSDEATVSALTDSIARGCIIVSTELDPVMSVSPSFPVSFEESAEVYAIGHDPQYDVTRCLSVTADSDRAKAALEDWTSGFGTFDPNLPSPSHRLTLVSDSLTVDRMGEAATTGRYYLMEESDPRYDYYRVETGFKVTAYAFGNTCNDVDCIRATVDMEDEGTIVLDYGPKGTGTTTSIETNPVYSDLDGNTLRIDQMFDDLQSINDISVEADMWHTGVTEENDGFACSETYSIGMGFSSPYPVYGDVELKFRTSIPA